MRKIKLTIFIIIILGIMLLPKQSFAVLQSNGKKMIIKYAKDWYTSIRNMESLGNGMGLQEEINDDLTTKGNSNNIDVHFQKNTEYGAIAILSASSYGNPGIIGPGGTTTGNITGIVLPTGDDIDKGAAYNKQLVAVRPNVAEDPILAFNGKYYDDYSNQQSKPGDAVDETKSWHGAYYADFKANGARDFHRAESSKIFTSKTWGNRATLLARATVVCGEGF